MDSEDTDESIRLFQGRVFRREGSFKSPALIFFKINGNEEEWTELENRCITELECSEILKCEWVSQDDGKTIFREIIPILAEESSLNDWREWATFHTNQSALLDKLMEKGNSEGWHIGPTGAAEELNKKVAIELEYERMKEASLKTARKKEMRRL